ncbi:MAG: CsbD family protein [Pseudonocardia sp.]
MSLVDKAKNKAEEVVGKVKEKAGAATGNEELEAEGRADQTSAAVKQTGEKIKDVAKDVKDAFKK